jgi:hypothetical protein
MHGVIIPTLFFTLSKYQLTSRIIFKELKARLVNGDTSFTNPHKLHFRC